MRDGKDLGKICVVRVRGHEWDVEKSAEFKFAAHKKCSRVCMGEWVGSDINRDRRKEASERWGEGKRKRTEQVSTTRKPPPQAKRCRNINEIKNYVYDGNAWGLLAFSSLPNPARGNERDRHFMLFMLCTTIQISLNCYGSLITVETMPCLPCARKGRSECARLSEWIQEIWE